jgi:hypothetical protein
MKLEVLNFMMPHLRLKRHHHVHTDALEGILASKLVTSWLRSEQRRRRRRTHPMVNGICEFASKFASCASFGYELGYELVWQMV